MCEFIIFFFSVWGRGEGGLYSHTIHQNLKYPPHLPLLSIPSHTHTHTHTHIHTHNITVSILYVRLASIKHDKPQKIIYLFYRLFMQTYRGLLFFPAPSFLLMLIQKNNDGSLYTNVNNIK